VRVGRLFGSSTAVGEKNNRTYTGGCETGVVTGDLLYCLPVGVFGIRNVDFEDGVTVACLLVTVFVLAWPE